MQIKIRKCWCLLQHGWILRTFNSISQSQKTTHQQIWNVQNRKIYGGRKWINDYHGQRRVEWRMTVNRCGMIHPCCSTYQHFITFIAYYNSIGWLYNDLFINLLGNGHLGYLQFWFIITIAAMNIHV